MWQWCISSINSSGVGGGSSSSGGGDSVVAVATAAVVPVAAGLGVTAEVVAAGVGQVFQ